MCGGAPHCAGRTLFPVRYFLTPFVSPGSARTSSCRFYLPLFLSRLVSWCAQPTSSLARSLTHFLPSPPPTLAFGIFSRLVAFKLLSSCLWWFYGFSISNPFIYASNTVSIALCLAQARREMGAAESEEDA